MTDILYCFDTEDFTSNTSANAIADLARTLTKEGVRACFCLTGLLARQLVLWGRNDVLEALKAHEIGLHSFGHSFHPTINEYTDREDFYEAYFRCLSEETLAADYIQKATGTKDFFAAVPPGNSFSYAAMYTYADMGIPAYCDTVCDTEDGQGVWYCNMYHMDYVRSFESMFYGGEEFDEDAFIEQLAGRRRAILYNHPNMMVCREFWDKLNYDRENKYPFGQWKECERRSSMEIETFRNGLIHLTRRLKSDNRFRFRSVEETVGDAGFHRKRTVTRGMLPAVRESLKNHLWPIAEPVSVSVSDIFDACEFFIKHENENAFTPDKTYGFLYAPSKAENTFSVPANALDEAVRSMKRDRFIPHEFLLCGEILGPADLLFLMLDFLCGEKELTVNPKEQCVSPDLFPRLKNLSLKGSWIHSDSFEDAYLSNRLKLQCWTMRF